MPRIRFAAAGLVLAALTLAACGGDPDQPAPPAAAPTTVAAAPSTVAPAEVPAEAGKPEPAGVTLADGRHPAYLTASTPMAARLPLTSSSSSWARRPWPRPRRTASRRPRTTS